VSNDEGNTENLGSLVRNASLTKDTIGKRKLKPRGSYRRYNDDQIEKLFDLVIEEGRTAKEAALITGFNIRTAQHYVKRYNDDEERRLPVCHRKPRIGAEDIRQKLCGTFTGLSISVSALHRHLVQKCRITLKKLEQLSAARDADRVINLRTEKVEEWEAMQDLDFARNCVFIDESGFDLHIQRNFGRSLKGTPARGTVPTGRGVTVSILGAISEAGVIDISLKKPQAATAVKKRTANGKVVSKCSKRPSWNKSRTLSSILVQRHGCTG